MSGDHESEQIFSNSTNLDTIEMTSKESNQQSRSYRRKRLKQFHFTFESVYYIRVSYRIFVREVKVLIIRSTLFLTGII